MNPREFHPLVDWGLVTAPQPDLENRVFHYARGKKARRLFGDELHAVSSTDYQQYGQMGEWSGRPELNVQRSSYQTSKSRATTCLPIRISMLIRIPPINRHRMYSQLQGPRWMFHSVILWMNSTPGSVGPLLLLAWDTDKELSIQSFRRQREIWKELVQLGVADPIEAVPGANVMTDKEILSFIRQGLQTVHHACCTCKMGRKTDR